MKRVVMVLLLVAAGLTLAAPAHAAGTTVWAFGATDNPTPVGTEPVPERLRGNSICPTKEATVRESTVGVYVVTFPCVGSVNGIVHVTAIEAGTRICNPLRWQANGGAEVVTIRCYGTNGVPTTAYPADAIFSVLYTTSDGVGVTSGGWYDYVQSRADGTSVTSYNSDGLATTVAHPGTGVYQVQLVNRGTGKVSGNVHVNAVDSAGGARQCQVGSWSPGQSVNLFTVTCYDLDGRPFDSGFVLAYHNQRSLTGAPAAPKLYAYLWSQYGGPPYVTYNSAGAPNTVEYATVDFAQIAGAATNVQITAYGASPMICQPSQPWEAGHSITVKDVSCTSPPKWPVHPFWFITGNADA